MDKTETIVNSMLWSAYGDALGFITELADEGIIAARTGGERRITHLRPWKRQLGGKFGVRFSLPSGTYSDDTQMRLAVCRSIVSNGRFDPETFSKVELPIFLAYCLGTGRSTRSAAESLRRNSVQWNTNFYETGYARYLDSGGNGVAMRVQPHAWSIGDDAPDKDLLLEVLRNGVITHGHPIALLGACGHALLLRDVLKFGSIPDPAAWRGYLDVMGSVPLLIAGDQELKAMWMPSWERESGVLLASAWEKSIVEMQKSLDVVERAITIRIMPETRESTYRQLVGKLGCFDKELRGSGTLTVLLSYALAFMCEDDPHSAMVAAVNALSSDTDTIASMAGALLGAVHSNPPPEAILDQDYLTEQARRIGAIRANAITPNHPYPDLATWSPPGSGVDSVAIDKDGNLFLRGLGHLSPLGEVICQGKDKNTLWRAFSLPWKQTVIIRYRGRPRILTNSDRPVQAPTPKPAPTPRAPIIQPRLQGKNENSRQQAASKQGILPFDDQECPAPIRRAVGNSLRSPTQVEASFNKIKRANFPDDLIGSELAALVAFPEGVELASALAARLYKALHKFKTQPTVVQDLTIDQRTDDIIYPGEFSPTLIGLHFHQIANNGTNDQAVAYAAIIAKAMMARARRARTKTDTTRSHISNDPKQ